MQALDIKLILFISLLTGTLLAIILMGQSHGGRRHTKNLINLKVWIIAVML